MCLRSVYEPSGDAGHKHIWPRIGGGCWCGAQRCEYMIPLPASEVKPQRIVPYRGSVAAVKSCRCTEAAALPSPYCTVHKGIVEAKHA